VPNFTVKFKQIFRSFFFVYISSISLEITMQIIFRKSLVKKKQAFIVLTLLLPILITGTMGVSNPTMINDLFSSVEPVTSDSTNYTVGVFPKEEYTWIVTEVRHENLELIFGVNWEDVFGLPEVTQNGYKFKANLTLIENNQTHFLIDYAEWDWIYRLNEFPSSPDSSNRYEFPVHPQNYTDTFEFSCMLPLFLPIPLVPYVFDTNLTFSYYTASDFTSYGGGLYVQYDRQMTIGEYVIDLTGVAEYSENGALKNLRVFFRNCSEYIKCLKMESLEPYHLGQSSTSCQVGDEFTWVLVNYNLTVLEQYFGDEFFERYGLLPHPERFQSIKMKVDGVSENNTSLRVDYSLYNWTSLEDSFPELSAKNSFYSFSKEPFNETRLTTGQIPFLIPEPTEFFLRYGRFGNQYVPYYDLYSCINLYFTQGEETLFGSVFYNQAGVLTTMIFSRSVQIGGVTELQLAFEIALYYDSPTPDYVGIEEGSVFRYDIYTNESINVNVAFLTKNYQNATVEVIKVFGEDQSSRRTPFIANFSMRGDYNLWELEDVLIVGYIHNDSNMYFDPLVISSLGPFYLAPLFVNNRMNWTDFSTSYNNYSIIKSSNYYSVSELQGGFNLYQRDNIKNLTFSYNYNESGVLTEFTVYYNDQLYHNCSLGKILPPPLPPLIEIDIDPPVITVLNPSSEKLFGVSPPVFNLTVVEEQLNRTWFSLSNGTIEFTQELSFTSGGSTVEISGQINQTFWNCFSDGNITVRFYANDSSGNLNWSEITVIKDATAPAISILNVMANEEFNNTAPEFELAITEIHLNFMWYTVNGSEIVYFNGSSCLIDQGIWESLPNGSVSVQFFALDEIGNLGTFEVVVIKQIEPESSPPVESDDPTVPGITIPLTIFQIISIVVILIAISNRKRKNAKLIV